MMLLNLFTTFFEIGLFTFGGGYAMIPLISQKVFENNWMSNSDLLNFIAISESTPGPFAINIATFIGNKNGGIAGAFAAVLGVVLPSFIVILIVAKLFAKFSENKYVKGCMVGMRPAVIGMLFYTVITMTAGVLFPDGLVKSVLFTKEFYGSVVIAVSMSVLAFKKVNPILIIAISAALGIIFGYLIL